jgi:hypothetical protein
LGDGMVQLFISWVNFATLIFQDATAESTIAAFMKFCIA